MANLGHQRHPTYTHPSSLPMWGRSTVKSYDTITAVSWFLHSLSPNKGTWYTEQRFNSIVYTFRSTASELVQSSKIPMLIYGFTDFTQELRSRDTPDVIGGGPDPFILIISVCLHCLLSTLNRIHLCAIWDLFWLQFLRYLIVVSVRRKILFDRFLISS